MLPALLQMADRGVAWALEWPQCDCPAPRAAPWRIHHAVAEQGALSGLQVTRESQAGAEGSGKAG